MSTPRKSRAEKYAAVLAILNEPGGRQLANAKIAQRCKTNSQSVQMIRDENRTPDEQAQYEKKREASLRALNNIFPGIYDFYFPQQTGGDKH